jgi:hypothetical protein
VPVTFSLIPCTLRTLSLHDLCQPCDCIGEAWACPIRSFP